MRLRYPDGLAGEASVRFKIACVSVLVCLGLVATPVAAAPVTLSYAFSANVVDWGVGWPATTTITGSFKTSFEWQTVFGAAPTHPNGVTLTDIAVDLKVHRPELRHGLDVARGEHLWDGRKMIALTTIGSNGPLTDVFFLRFLVSDSLGLTLQALQYLRLNSSVTEEMWITNHDITLTAVPEPTVTMLSLVAMGTVTMAIRRRRGVQ